MQKALGNSPFFRQPFAKRLLGKTFKKGHKEVVFIMQKEFSLADGKKLVSLARKSIEYFSAGGTLLREPCKDKKLMQQRGVFVTLHSFPEKELRGCIGFPYPLKPLWNAVIEAAVEAAFHDPRFAPIQASELEKVIIEISVLSMPEEIRGERKELPGKIEVGKDGLIVKRKLYSGLLLPQVAPEQKWNAETFLHHCCLKAGLPGNSWQMNGTQVFKFQAQIFSETGPNGAVEEA